MSQSKRCVKFCELRGPSDERECGDAGEGGERRKQRVGDQFGSIEIEVVSDVTRNRWW